jgi:hypothetical protein
LFVRVRFELPLSPAVFSNCCRCCCPASEIAFGIKARLGRFLATENGPTVCLVFDRVFPPRPFPGQAPFPAVPVGVRKVC